MTDYKLMPKQITEEMAKAFWEEYSKDRADDLLMRCYKAMYAVVPHHSQQPADYELARLQKRVKELEAALNDQLNDCINFDGGKLTDGIMEQSTAILRKGEEV